MPPSAGRRPIGPSLIENLMRDEHWRQQDYSERSWDILEYLTEEKVEIPTSLIGRMDLINEITRRCRSAYGLSEIPPSGQPLASGVPDQPLPPLAHLEISEHTKKFNHVTQEMADHVLGIAYEKRQDLWLAFAEEQRYEVRLDATVQMRSLLREVVDAESPDQNNMWAAMYLYDEPILRIFHMCGIGQ
jgi:hypothetical protein